ncbi:MAG: peptide chain release factor-like protein [Candidatus Nealsonbacteria bacterium]
MYKTDQKSLKRETEVFRFGASSKGGQRANRKKTGIRLRHLPSGLEIKVVEERFQGINLEIAFDRLKKALKELNAPPKKRVKTKIPRVEKRRRLERKKIHSFKKELRKKPVLE